MASIFIRNSKEKSFIAAVAAVAVFFVNAVTAFAAPFGYSEGDSVREKALNSYSVSDASVLAMNSNHLSKLFDNVTNVITFGEETVTEAMPFETVKRANNSIKKGETIVAREGVPGTATNTYRLKYVDGVEKSRELVSSVVVTEPVDKIVEYGNMEEAPALASKATPVIPQAAGSVAPTSYKYVIECNATAYSHEECGGRGAITASGLPLEVGMLAVDPRVIPMGSRVYVEALDGSWTYGYALVADTGGAIKGNRVDLSMGSRAECYKFGRRKCRVYVIE